MSLRHGKRIQGLPDEVDWWGRIFNNRLLFKKDRILFSLLIFGNFCGGQGCDGGVENRYRWEPLPGKTLELL